MMWTRWISLSSKRRSVARTRRVMMPLSWIGWCVGLLVASLRLQRNLIAHGVWMVNDAGIPHVTWHSHFLESDDYAVVRSFSWEDFGSFLESARAILNAFDETKRNLEELLPGKWPTITEMGAGKT